MLSALLLLTLATLSAPPSDLSPQPLSGVTRCLECHGDRDLSVTLPNGETQSLFVDVQHFKASVHGDKLECGDCHSGMTEIPHPARPFKTRREFTIAYYETCKRCHFASYTKTLDSVHQAALARGDATAPLCVDCHGYHDMTPPDQPRSRISQTCAKCHEGVSSVYVKSVHGRALIEESNTDVPVCTDCHHSHDVSGPRDRAWLQGSPGICGSCHSNTRLMQKYGLSTNVQQTYLADFHGMTASLRGSAESNGKLTALCVDCHGVHNITPVEDPNSAVMRANLVQTCRRCHPDASENFPAAWMSHYEPSWDKAPLVYSIQVFYLLVIPFIVGGLVLQILLHLWRVVVNR